MTSTTSTDQNKPSDDAKLPPYEEKEKPFDGSSTGKKIIITTVKLFQN